jgi:peptide/nickel transport system permease protein
VIRTIGARLLQALPLIVIVVTATFFLGLLSPVDPAEVLAGPGASQESVDALRHELGLDRPAWQQYLDWVGGALHGDLGQSIYGKAEVTDLIVDAMPVTLSLTAGGLLVGLLLGLPAGVFSALRAGRPADRVVGVFATVGQAMPSFWLGMMLIVLLALQVPVFPAVGYVGLTEDLLGWASHLVLPSIALGLITAAAVSRQTRSSLIGVLQQDYIRTALSKGASRRRVVVKHAFKNAAIPVVTVLSFQVAHLLGGAIVVERLFAMPGLGTLVIDAVVRRDPGVIQAFVLFAVVVIIVVNIILDITYAWLNPKVRAA